MSSVSGTNVTIPNKCAGPLFSTVCSDGDFSEHMLSRDFRFSDTAFRGAGSEFDQRQLFELSRARSCQWTVVFITFLLILAQGQFCATAGIYYRKGL
jgi:hypothetical protein